MHSLLETYLSEVAAHLSAMPAGRRSEELREMRTHLENAVIVNRELGRSEGEAAQTALVQFGPSQDLGENVVWAWRRGRALDRRSFWGTTVSLPLMLTCLLLLQDHYFGVFLQHILPPWFNQYCVKHPSVVMTLVQGMFLAVFGLSGLVAGSLFPKRAMRGVCLGLAFFWTGWAAVMGLGHGGFWHFLSWICGNGWTLTAIVSAWGSSRWKKARIGPVRLARN